MSLTADSVPEIMVVSSLPLARETVAVTLYMCHMTAYLLVVIHQRLLMSGDVELNPGPLDQETMEKILSTVDDTTLDEDDWSDIAFECSSLAPHWEELCVFLRLPMGTNDAIKEKHGNKELSCLNEVLKLWILRKYKTEKYGFPSWKMLLKAVWKVDENLFEKLAKTHQDTQLVPMTSEQVVDKPEEMASNADSGFEASSVVNGSTSSQLTKQVVMEAEIPDHVLTQIRRKYSTICNAYNSQCPCQLKNVASLELVEQRQYSSNRFRDERGKWVRLPYSTLFKGDHDTRNGSKRILVVGEAGIGKTILCASIAEDWANGKLFRDFRMVLLLPLNQRGVSTAQNLLELFKNLYEFDSNACSDVEMYLMANRADNILIIADGWDELCESESREESFLYRLLFGDLLSCSSLTVVVTSRLSTSVPQHFISRFIKVKGFSEATTKAYIQLEFSSDLEKLSYITGQLDTNPLVDSMCSVPLNLAMICNLCRSCDDPLPSTMPGLYDKLAWSLAQLKINSAKKYGSTLKLSNHHDLPDKLQQSWLLLCQLAFKTIENSHATFSQMEAARYLTSELETFGLLKPVCRGIDEVMFSFLQPAFECYLAVLHFIKQPLSAQLVALEKVAPLSPIFWRFYLSMSRDENCDVISEAAIQMFLKLHHSCNDVYLLSFESKNEIIDREVVKSLHTSESPIMLHSHNAYDCVAMIHVLEKIEQQCIVEINFQNCKLKAMQISKLASALGNHSEMIQVKGLDLSDNSLNNLIVVDFFSRAVPSLRSLEKLFLRSCEIGAESLSAIVNALAKSSCQCLTQLDLSFNSLPVDCLQYFQCHIDGGNLQKMEILILKGSLAKDVTMSFLKSFATTLSSKCQCLRRLDLSANELGACDNPNLSAIVSQLTASLGNSFDLLLDDDYMSEVDNTFLAIMEESIRNKGTIDHTIAHGVIVGPGRAGKDSLLRRLMGEGSPDPNTISPSTGVLENVVKVEVKKLCTVATAVCNLIWHRLEYDEEALELMMTTAKNYSHSGSIMKPISVKYIVQGKSSRQDAIPSDTANKSKIAMIKATKPNESETTDSVSVDENEEMSECAFVYSSDMAPVEIFKKAVKLRHMDALRMHLESSWSLYLTNTGGQIEFQEHLPLLVCGPSIFFVVFPLHHDLDKPYEVQYQYPDGSVKKYSSTPTLIQELLQTLATIYALDYASIQIGDTEVNLKPKVFFIGTHKDCLLGTESDREKKIKQIDKKLQTYVRQTSLFHQGSIQFAQSLKQMIFTVDNLSKDDDDFQKIRSAVQQTVEKKCYTEFTVQCPSSWLIFSLILRAKHRSNRVLRLEDCFKIAQECGISSHEELTTALSFIHSRLGLVRYFNVKELDSLVVIDPQVLFDKITDLIVETFIDVNAEENEIEEFRQKGIISVAVMKKISEKSNKDVHLPFTWLTKLLNHLRVAAFFKDHHGEKYFFPSVLCHVHENQDSSSYSLPTEPQANQPPPFLIAFETGFCPRGIAGALMKCLMTNEMKSSRSWELLPHKIFRNQVSFHIEACGDITIKVLPTHLEIAVDSDVDITETESQTCKEVYIQIAKSMKIVTCLYKKCEYFWTFYCTLAKCKTHPHPAVIEWNCNIPVKLRCKLLNESGGLPKGYELWNIQRKGVRLLSTAKIQSRHLGRIAESMAEWEGQIADEFKLTDSDVAAIKTEYPGKLKLQMRAALQKWKQKNGSEATCSKLIKTFERAGYKSYADEVRKITQASDSETDDFSGSEEEQSQIEQPQTYPPCQPQSVSHLSPVTPKSTETCAYYIIIDEENLPKGDRSEVCSEEILESHNVTKFFVPKLSPNKFDSSRRDQDHPDEQHPTKDVSEAEESGPALSKDQTTIADSSDVKLVATVFEDKPMNSIADSESALDTESMVTETTAEVSKFDEQDVSEAEESGPALSKDQTTIADSADIKSVTTVTEDEPKENNSIADSALDTDIETTTEVSKFNEAGKKCIALYNYMAMDAEELSITKNEILTVVDNSGTWWRVGNDKGRTGLVPSNYVQPQATPTRTPRSKLPPDVPHMYHQPDLMVSRNGPASLNIRAVAKYKYTSTREDELSLEKGDEVIVMEKEADGWWRGKTGARIGWFPYNYVEEVQDSAPASSASSSSGQQPPSREKSFICGVVALYSFNSGNPEELPFEKGDLMDIIDQPADDPDWWEARKPDGSTGLVPRNYVEVVHDADSVVGKPAGAKPGGLGGMGGMGGAAGSRVPPPFSHENWYYGRVPRREAEGILNSQAQNGQFIVRESETKPGDYSISMTAPDRIKHFNVKLLPDGRLGIGQRKFDSMEELIQHYRRAPIYTTTNEGKMYLGSGLPKR